MAVIYQDENGKRVTVSSTNKSVERTIDSGQDIQHSTTGAEGDQVEGVLDVRTLAQAQNVELGNTRQGLETNQAKRIPDQLKVVSGKNELKLTLEIDVPEKESEINNMIAGLKLLQPNSRQVKVEKFRALFPVIKDVLADNVPQRAVIDYLASQGLKLSPNTFRAMFEAESKRIQDPGASAGS